MTEEIMLDTLKNWSYLQRRIKSLNKLLNEKAYKITASYSSDVRVMSSGDANKIEAFCLSRMKFITEKDMIARRMRDCIRAYQNTDLSELERETIKATVKKNSLVKIAELNNIAQAQIYRIRDRTIKKMCITLQNEVKNR